MLGILHHLLGLVNFGILNVIILQAYNF